MDVVTARGEMIYDDDDDDDDPRPGPPSSDEGLPPPLSPNPHPSMIYPRMIYLSSTGVYGSHGGAWVT